MVFFMGLGNLNIDWASSDPKTHYCEALGMVTTLQPWEKKVFCFFRAEYWPTHKK